MRAGPSPPAIDGIWRGRGSGSPEPDRLQPTGPAPARGRSAEAAVFPARYVETAHSWPSPDDGARTVRRACNRRMSSSSVLCNVLYRLVSGPYGTGRAGGNAPGRSRRPVAKGEKIERDQAMK